MSEPKDKLRLFAGKRTRASGTKKQRNGGRPSLMYALF